MNFLSHVRLLRVLLLCVVAAGAIACGLCATAEGASAVPAWHLTSTLNPTRLGVGQRGVVKLAVFNIGSANSAGPVTAVDKLPANLKVIRAGAYGPFIGEGANLGWNCAVNETTVSCLSELGVETEVIEADYYQSIGIEVEVTAPGVGTSEATVSGGGAVESASLDTSFEVGGEAPVTFGLAQADASFVNEDGTRDERAGSHPYVAAVSIALDTRSIELEPGVAEVLPVEQPEKLDVVLPSGFVGSATAVPRCSQTAFAGAQCPPDSQVGQDLVETGAGPQVLSVYSLVPPAGEPAQFGFNLSGIDTYIDFGVQERVAGDPATYTLSGSVPALPERQISENTLLIWGVPADPVHNTDRKGAHCISSETGVKGCSVTAPEVPLLTLPSTCGPVESYGVSSSPWGSPTDVVSTEATLEGDANGLTGCSQLSLVPSFSAAPQTTVADSPTGLETSLSVNQEGIEAPSGLAAPDVHGVRLTLPEGMDVNPGAATGLTACGASEAGLGQPGEAQCQRSSQLATVTLKSPLLAEPLEGAIYLLPSEPPNLSVMLAVSGSGVDLKLPGTLSLDESTGRAVAEFASTPQLPFEHLEVSIKGTPSASFVTPPGCGTSKGGETTIGSWAGPTSDSTLGWMFGITSMPNGLACGSSKFVPQVVAGDSNPQAGEHTSFSLTLSREDGEQRLRGVSGTTPPGLTGEIAHVPLCPEPAAAQGKCSAESLIGTASVIAGAGGSVLELPEPGQTAPQIYLTTGYDGAPFGLSIVVPVVAGPFTLPTQVVRASVAVNPVTAQLTVVAGPIPRIVSGVPTDVRQIVADIDRPGFLRNPTNCADYATTGSTEAESGAGAAFSAPFQVGGCRGLAFKPGFSASTQGHTTKAGGASLSVKLTFPTLTGEANIKAVKVDLPEQLPSRLTTLQKACVAKVFEADPANCPKESKVGYAKAITPILPVPLEGPAYFVSHGGEAFPSLTIVLQGYGVTIDLTGTTFISKAGITSSTFKQVPDVPVTSFELTLPTGPYSALATNLSASAKRSFCATKLAMPTAFIAQNGTEIHESTAIGISGCAKTTTLTRAQKLTKALKACKQKAKGKRPGCVRHARKEFGQSTKKKK